MNKINHNKRFSIILTVILGTVLIAIIMILFLKTYNSIAIEVGKKSLDRVDQQKSQDLETFFLPLIRDKLNKFKIGELRNETIPEEGKEIRIWGGFSHNGIRGLFLRSDGTNWSTVYIPNIDKYPSSSNAPRSLSPPKSEWPALSAKLQQLGLYDLPGEPDKIPGRLSVKDSVMAVIEIKTSSSYRAYKYMGLFYYQGVETKKVEMIIDTLSSEFGIELY
jgi:hypothetical protein